MFSVELCGDMTMRWPYDFKEICILVARVQGQLSFKMWYWCSVLFPLSPSILPHEWITTMWLECIPVMWKYPINRNSRWFIIKFVVVGGGVGSLVPVTVVMHLTLNLGWINDWYILWALKCHNISMPILWLPLLCMIIWRCSSFSPVCYWIESWLIYSHQLASWISYLSVIYSWNLHLSL